MPYANNRNYNTRNSGRFNSGQFVSAGELSAQSGTAPAPAPAPPAAAPATAQYAPLPQRNPQGKGNSFANQAMQFGKLYSPAEGQNNSQTPKKSSAEIKKETVLECKDVEMAVAGAGAGAAEGGKEPAAGYSWMKFRLSGVKKISNKERRRRQNETLRKLLTPKNALMVLNEMMPREHLANQFKVEAVPAQYYGSQSANSFSVDLNVEGRSYKAFGENKMQARNNAAELAIRDIIIKRMTKLASDVGNANGSSPAPGAGAVEGGMETEGGEDGDAADSLPMIQIASFALHKLFSEWEYEGYKVPQIKSSQPSTSESGPNPSAPATNAGAPGAAAGAPGAAPGGNKKSKSKVKTLPLNASSMHPAMLLTYMRPRLEYKQLAADGDRPQNMLYTVGVEVDGFTYIGKATNKKEARKAAAMAACQQIFGVQFDATAPAPAAASAPTATQSPA